MYASAPDSDFVLLVAGVLCARDHATATAGPTETALPFAQRVWDHVQAWTGNRVMKPTATMCIEEWWNQEVHLQTKEERRSWAAINMYTVWNLWKE